MWGTTLRHRPVVVDTGSVVHVILSGHCPKDCRCQPLSPEEQRGTLFILTALVVANTLGEGRWVKEFFHFSVRLRIFLELLLGTVQLLARPDPWLLFVPSATGARVKACNIPRRNDLGTPDIAPC